MAIIISICFNYPIYQILPYSLTAFNSYIIDFKSSFKDIWSNNNYSDYLNKFFNFIKNSGEIAFVTAKSWDGSLAETTHITSIGNIMYTSYSIWLIITSLILLLAMVGAIVITIKKS